MIGTAGIRAVENGPGFASWAATGSHELGRWITSAELLTRTGYPQVDR
ncbi:MAG TPA: hypothetical protein VMW80_13350 [Candidatus Dormibacteraeota bacterium]|nr:hypothetical protein [Candidatus Dormibacteraeota bacterium]